MRATKEERLAIGKQVHDGELTKQEASKKYGIPERTIWEWVMQYRESIGERKPPRNTPNRVLSNERAAYENMSREELIDALILSKANELRAKKGYEVRGDGANKEFIPLNNKNSK
jgi:transposase